MDGPKTCYARAPDGAYLAYQAFGEGPTDLLYVPGWHSHLEVYWEQPLFASFMRRLAASFRVITFDKRGTGLSERSLGTPNFETMMDDVRAVLDAAGSRRPVLWGDGVDGGGSCAVFAASFPDRALAFVWWAAGACTLATNGYPWGQSEETFGTDDAFIEQAWGDEKYAAELMEFVGCPSSSTIPSPDGGSRSSIATLAPPAEPRPSTIGMPASMCARSSQAFTCRRWSRRMAHPVAATSCGT